MTLVEIYDYDGVLAGPSGYANEALLRRISKRVTHSNYVLCLNTGRSFEQLEQLGVIKTIEAEASPHLHKIAMSCEKGAQFSTYKEGRWQHALADFSLPKEVLHSLYSLCENLISQLPSALSSKAKISLVVKSTFFSIEVYAQHGQALQSHETQSILKFFGDYLSQNVGINKQINLDLAQHHFDYTHIALDLQSKKHGKAPGALRIKSWLERERSLNNYCITCFGDSRSDLEMRSVFSEEHKAIHVHTGCEELFAEDLNSPLLSTKQLGNRLAELKIQNSDLKYLAKALAASSLDQATEKLFDFIEASQNISNDDREILKTGLGNAGLLLMTRLPEYLTVAQ